MYSLVLMATMTMPATVPDHGGRRCFGGCFGGGCHGSRWGGCHGGRWGGCHGGCYGGGHCGGGCSGGCYGGHAYYGGSCHGGHMGYGCTGHAGCTGVAGGGYYGGGMVGGGYYGGGGGYYGGGAVVGQPGVGGGVMTAPAPAPAGGGAVAPAPAPGGAVNPPRGDAANGPAHIYVSLPADAKLYVDGQLTKTMDKANRSFETPALDRGVEYRYVMKAEVIRDGQIQTETKTVLVRSGAVVHEEFGSLLTITTASSR
jgi:uncharacterized protein (TIGR03000 family)